MVLRGWREGRAIARHHAERQAAVREAIERGAAHVSELAELEALSHHFGFPVGDGRIADLFTKPDAIRRSLAAA